MTHLDKGTACNLKKNMVALKGTKWNNLCMCMLSEKARSITSIYGELFLRRGDIYVSIYRDKPWMEIQKH